MIPLETPAVCGRVPCWLLRAKEHDVGLYQHSVLVGGLTLRFARHLGRPASYCEQLYRAALFHDGGKLRIPSGVLQKATPLTPAEMRLMETHPGGGYRMLVNEGGHDELTLSVVRDHHERLDGNGYPRGLKAALISEAVRIVTICNVFAAMTEKRPYRESFTSQGAIERMWTKKSSRLDMDLVRQFEAMTTRLSSVDLAAWNERWAETLFWENDQ